MQDLTELVAPEVDLPSSANWVRLGGSVVGINDLGQIAGHYTCTVGVCVGVGHAVMLTDGAPPTCQVVANGTGSDGRRFIQIAIQDIGSGLAQIKIVSSSNAFVQTPAFTPSTPRSQTVLVRQKSARSLFSIRLTVADIGGNSTTCNFQSG
jgi:hypothetical protein